MKITVCLGLVLCSISAQAADLSAEINTAPDIPQATQTTGSTGSVRRSNFTSAISEHEPVDNLLSLSNTQSTVYYFTELRNLEGQTVTHRWEYNGEILADVKLKVGSQRWRVWSQKTLLPSWIGEIHTSVLDEQGHVLATGVLHYTEASQQ